MTVSVVCLSVLIFGMAYLFITERVSVDLVALCGLMFITLLGYVTPQQAFSGFSSPAIVTMISMFFIGGALKRTGVAGMVARFICKQAGTNEAALVAAVMLLAAFLSAGMNNVAATAVLLPAVIAVGNQSNVSPSRLLMPLSFGVILGGMTTAIGTTPNIVMIDVMKEAGVEPFSFLSYTPYGFAAVFAGTTFIALSGRKLLPDRKVKKRKHGGGRDLTKVYKLSERLFSLRVPADSLLAGQTLEQSRFGTLFGARVVAIRRENERKLYPTPTEIIRPNDQLVVQGRRSRVEALLKFRGISVEAAELNSFAGNHDTPCAALVSPQSEIYIGQDLRAIHFRERYGLAVVGINRGANILYTNLGRETIAKGDVLRVVGTQDAMQNLQSSGDFTVSQIPFTEVLFDRLFTVRIPESSPLIGQNVRDSRIGELVGIQIVAMYRSDQTLFGIGGKEVLQAGDKLLVVGNAEEVGKLGLLGSLVVESEEPTSTLESRDMVLSELIFPPRSRAIGKNLLEINFRERFDSQVLAVWHEGRPYRSHLATRTLQLGDALLIHSPRSKLSLLREDSDFVLLGDIEEAPVPKMQTAASVLAFLVVTGLSVSGITPVHIASVIGALIVLLTRSIRIDDAYSEVSWKVVFLVAALIPFGIALNSTGTADALGSLLAAMVGPFGFAASVMLLSILASIMSQMLDGAVAVVLVAPIALDIAKRLDGDPRVMLMAVTLSASIAFLTPFSHKASLLVMGAGGYRVKDYTRLGLPITAICFAVIWGMLLFF